MSEKCKNVWSCNVSGVVVADFAEQRTVKREPEEKGAKEL